ncbi:MAG: response regulator [Blastocatellia bacterium]|nr:response regulator [Blastocatellia bacterium]
MKQRRVLIVDDEPMIRWVMTQALKDWGFESIEAETASSARARFEEGAPDIVMLDINLPDASGLELLRRFKRERPEVPVIIVSGDVVVENTLQALRGGADNFITKPIDLKEMRLALEGAGAKAPVASAGDGAGREKVLVVTDSEEQLRSIHSLLNADEFEIECVRTQEEFDAVCVKPHDLAIVDLNSAQLLVTLPKLRRSSAHDRIPVLVSSTRIEDDPNLAGLLPQYRAMACSPTELQILMRRRSRALHELQAARRLL